MSVTIGAIAAVVGTNLGKIAEGAIGIIKIVAAVSFSLVFVSAIISLVGFLEVVFINSFVGELFGIFSMCLPFNAAVVFGGIVAMLTAILSFLVARKVYMLTLNLIGV